MTDGDGDDVQIKFDYILQFPTIKPEVEAIVETKQGTAKSYFDTSDMRYLNLLQNLCKRAYRRLLSIFDISSSLYPELFQILWQSTLPCFGHDNSDHMLLDCLVGGNTISPTWILIIIDIMLLIVYIIW